MRNYRFILLNLYSVRVNRKGKFWLEQIKKFRDLSPETNQIEKNTYDCLSELIVFLLQTKGAISYKKIRAMIEPTLLNYDERYICDVGELLNIVELCNLQDEIDGKELLRYLKYFLKISDS